MKDTMEDNITEVSITLTMSELEAVIRNNSEAMADLLTKDIDAKHNSREYGWIHDAQNKMMEQYMTVAMKQREAQQS